MRGFGLTALVAGATIGLAGMATAQQRPQQGMNPAQMQGMDHSKMQGMTMQGMDHSNMPGMQGSAAGKKQPAARRPAQQPSK